MILPISSRKTLPAHASVRPRISSWSILKTWNTNSTWERVWKTSQTLHFVFEHESREWNLEREWNESRERCKRSERSESYVTFVTNVTNETNVTNVTNVKQEMAIGGDATRHSLRLFLSLTLCLFDSSSLCLFLSPSRRFVTLSHPPKIQQFWAIFQRFDINTFNLSEHFPSPNFANSAHNFSLPSPN